MVQKRIGETEFCVEINILNEQKQHLMDDSLNLAKNERHWDEKYFVATVKIVTLAFKYILGISIK